MASRNYSSIRTEYYCSPHYILHSIYQIQNEKKLKVTLEFKMLEQNWLNLLASTPHLGPTAENDQPNLKL